MVIYSPPSIKMGVGGNRGRRRLRSLPQSFRGARSANPESRAMIARFPDVQLHI